MRLERVLALAILCIACSACSRVKPTERVLPAATGAPVQAKVPLLTRYTLQVGSGITADATMAKAAPWVSNGFFVRAPAGVYEIAWQGDGLVVVYSALRGEKKLTVVASNKFQKSDTAYHDIYATVIPSKGGNHITVGMDGASIIVATDRRVILTGRRVDVTALVNGFVKRASVEKATTVPLSARFAHVMRMPRRHQV